MRDFLFSSPLASVAILVPQDVPKLDVGKCDSRDAHPMTRATVFIGGPRL